MIHELHQAAAHTRARLAANAEADAAAVSSWAVIGPFNDTNATGLFRSVSTIDADSTHTAIPVDLNQT